MSKPMKVTLTVKVPDKLTTTFFELPCVKSAMKYEGQVCYVIQSEAATRQIAEPGMWVIHLVGCGYDYWKVVTEEKYLKYYAK